MKNIFQKVIVIAASFSLLACGSSKPEAASGEGSSDSLHIELKTGILDYVDYEYVEKDFFPYGAGDPEKTVCFNFDYTNLESEPKTYNQDFWVKALQNGYEIESLEGFAYDKAPETVKNCKKTVSQNETLRIGLVFVLNDDSPVMLSAFQNGGTEKSERFTITLKPYAEWKADQK